MYVPNSNWTHIRTRPLSAVGMFYYTVEGCRCGFATPERLPGSNETWNRIRHEQEEHEDHGCFEAVECSECGHLHFVPAAATHIDCPLDDCGCRFAKGA